MHYALTGYTILCSLLSLSQHGVHLGLIPASIGLNLFLDVPRQQMQVVELSST